LRPENLYKLTHEERLKIVREKYLNKIGDDSSDEESSTEVDIHTFSVIDLKNFIGEPFYTNKTGKWYLAFNTGTEIFRVGDVVTFHSGKKLPYVGKILELYENKNGEKNALACWYFRPYETELPKDEHHNKELFSSTLVDINPLGAIVNKVQLGDSPKTLKEGKELFCNRYYDSDKVKN
jgi:hypothetical protein